MDGAYFAALEGAAQLTPRGFLDAFVNDALAAQSGAFKREQWLRLKVVLQQQQVRRGSWKVVKSRGRKVMCGFFTMKFPKRAYSIAIAGFFFGRRPSPPFFVSFLGGPSPSFPLLILWVCCVSHGIKSSSHALESSK
jgi:hypothetical protein